MALWPLGWFKWLSPRLSEAGTPATVGAAPGVIAASSPLGEAEAFIVAPPGWLGGGVVRLPDIPLLPEKRFASAGAAPGRMKVRSPSGRASGAQTVLSAAADASMSGSGRASAGVNIEGSIGELVVKHSAGAARGYHNPTDEELAMMVALLEAA